MKDMAERLPVGAARNIKSPSFSSFSSNPASGDVSTAAIDQLSGPMTCHEPDSNGSNSLVLSNGSSITSTRNSSHNKLGQSEVITRNGSRTEGGPNHNECVEQDEPGVYITFTSLPGGVKDLKRVRFSRKRFSEKQAEQWWVDNRARVYEQYNVHMVDKSSASVGDEDLAH
ncbi:hypothetical protein HHK36_032330 [Tetracentron sinense]|uniref:BRX domain-containing protein n=1 Tax=Tetracentron sinense TaxID=13715 RepID=A0A835CXQ2_TETSI|nr:hypothetical protein HHK36_032330 [Tetracentron sinense]